MQRPRTAVKLGQGRTVSKCTSMWQYSVLAGHSGQVSVARAGPVRTAARFGAGG